MNGARKVGAPQEFVDWPAKENADWKPSYPFNEPDIKRSVIASLFVAQRGICVYCGVRLDLSKPGKTFHVEHFRPQALYNDLSVAFENLFLSCGQNSLSGDLSQTCGTHKDDWFDEDRCVEPNYPDCTQRFKFLLNGTVVSNDPDDDAANTMIEVLNLNHSELSTEREATLLLIDSGQLDADDFWDDPNGTAESLAHVAFQHSGKIMP